jgi:glycosyltransferase involved in cell wall biosynthesis
MIKPSLSVVILTFNEENHIQRCIESVKDIATSIFVIDSFSNDKTVQIAKKNGAIILQNKWPNNHSVQFNWALENCNIKTKWVMRLDADEVISQELVKEINTELTKNNNIKGYMLNRGHIFLGKKMLHGGNYPVKLLRIWEYGFGYCEDKLMDEHIALNKDYETKVLKGSFWDHNLNDITWWTEKHNSYSTKEAIMQLQNKYGDSIPNSQNSFKRFLKYSVYEKLPKSLRAFLYFSYRYFIKLGFLDGYQGLIWNFLQGFWYRFLVDVKVYEIEKKSKENNLTIKEIVKNEYGYDL